jgi:outer membrane cobalamin receptor
MRKTLRVIPLVCLLAIVSGSVIAADQPGSQKPEDQLVEITGSHIPKQVRRIGRTTDSVQPLYVIDRTEIKRSGATTVADVLRTVPFAKVNGR